MNAPELRFERCEHRGTVSSLDLAALEATRSTAGFFEPSHLDLFRSLGRHRIEQRFGDTTTLVFGEREGLIEHLLCRGTHFSSLYPKDTGIHRTGGRRGRRSLAPITRAKPPSPHRHPLAAAQTAAA
jgi:hypothetical protein